MLLKVLRQLNKLIEKAINLRTKRLEAASCKMHKTNMMLYKQIEQNSLHYSMLETALLCEIEELGSYKK